MTEHRPSPEGSSVQDPQLPAEMEQLLRRRALSAAEQPWLELKVQQQVDAREQARRWLQDNPGGLLGGGRLLIDRGIAARLLSMLGAAALGGLLGWQLGSMSSLSIPWVSNFSSLAAIISALLASLATQLPNLRSMFSD